MNRIILCLLMIALVTAAPLSYAFDNEITHRDITRIAVLSSKLNPILIDRLGFRNGTETEVNYTGIDLTKETPFIPSSATITKLIRDGSYAEDVPLCRATNHFHNPLKSWNQSGMSDDPGWLDMFCSDWKPWYSNILWATGGVSNFWDWQHTRSAYLLALTSPVEQTRNNYYAATFWGLGHILHLLQDMAVPAHVRNDFTGHWTFPHMIIPYSPEKFEAFVKSRPSLVTSIQTTVVDRTNSANTGYWDADLYAGNNPAVTISDPLIGLAEYTNANFFSRYTTFTEDSMPIDVHYFPYPRKSSTTTFEEMTDSGAKRIYFSKAKDGETVRHLAVAGRLYKVLSVDPALQRTFISLDDKCYEDYANLLLPKAVGYSAGLLNYFFRGDIRLTYQTGSTPGYVIVNKTNEDMKGLFQVFYDDKEKGRTELWRSENLSIRASGTSGRVDFAIPDQNKATEPGKYILVFKGKIGNEVGAVVGNISGRTLEISPPDQYVYSIIDGSIEPQQFTKLKAKIRNTSNEEIKAGTVQAVAKYRKRTDYQPDLSTDPPDPLFIEDDYSYSMSDAVPVTSLSSTEATEVLFFFTNNPIPAGITDLYLQVIFQGTIGSEVNTATAVGTKDPMEPTHHVFWNNTDMVSLNGDLYTAFQIRENPDLMKLVGNDNIDPEVLTYRIAYFGQNPPPANLYDSVIAENIPAGRYIRLISLLDKQRGNYGRLAWDDTTGRLMLAFSGAKNQEEGGVFRYTPVTTFRNIRQHYFEGVIDCEPAAADPSTGNRYCAYPEAEAIIPPDLTPYPVTTVFP